MTVALILISLWGAVIAASIYVEFREDDAEDGLGPELRKPDEKDRLPYP